MNTPDPERKETDTRWENHVGEKETRKLRARRDKDRSIWFGLGTFGVIGWSVVAPALIGLFVGMWIDRALPSRFSWTLMLFLGGLALGCYNAWRWLFFESGLIEREEEQDENGDIDR